MIPTAREFIINKEVMQGFLLTNNTEELDDIIKSYIEFAKLHVEAALKEASEKGYATSKEPKLIGYRDLKDANNNTIGKPIPIYSKSKYNIDKDSILNAYPTSNIK